jgi:hypothetical protein
MLQRAFFCESSQTKTPITLGASLSKELKGYAEKEVSNELL